MQSNLAAKFAPAVANERRIDVSVNGSEATIQLSTWAEGIGWCGQKTMSFDETMLEDLHRMVSAARVRIKAGRSDAESINGKVLDFPTVV